MSSETPRTGQIVDDGRRANLGGVPRDSCPYMPESHGSQRDDWLYGWDDMQARQNRPSTVNTGNIPAG